MRRIILCCVLVIAMMLCIYIAYAADNRVELGNLGVYFTVDSMYDIITNAKKNEYSQAIQQSFDSEKEIMAYAENHGAVIVIFD